MSHNLTLRSRSKDIGLYQTSTDLTWAARATGYKNAKTLYFQHLDEWVQSQMPKLHPRATKAQRKAVQSTQAWKDYEFYRDEVAKHKAVVEAALREGATWGST